ncbi:AAA family ATPase [Vibrio sinaloensis]|nr:AAA family ATPase [Vibrio sinaloensis]
MKLLSCAIRNFRRLECVSIDFEEGETILVGPNNAGKKRQWLLHFGVSLEVGFFSINDLSVSKVSAIDEYGRGNDEQELPTLELDLWFSIDPEKDIVWQSIYTIAGIVRTTK